jgi:hypothetical protein
MTTDPEKPNEEVVKTFEAEAGIEAGTAASESGGESSENLGDFDGGRILMDMVSDPDIQAVLLARREGRAVKITDANAEPEAEPSPAIPTAELDDFDDDIKRVAELLHKQISSKLDPVIEKVSVLEGLAQGMQRQAIDGQIKAVAEKYPDFEKYRKKMGELARGDGKGLGVEELLLLAKHRAGELALTEPSTHSERPTPSPRRRPALNKDKGDAPRRGRKGFQVTLADALENLDFSRE